MLVKKFIDFINENKGITESDIREYVREEWSDAKESIFMKVNAKFPLDNNDISSETNSEIDGLINKLIDLYTKMTIENISGFEKTWGDDERIKVGDTVKDEDGLIYFVNRMGSNNNFYDESKHKFISLDSVKKQS